MCREHAIQFTPTVRLVYTNEKIVKRQQHKIPGAQRHIVLALRLSSCLLCACVRSARVCMRTSVRDMSRAVA